MEEQRPLQTQTQILDPDLKPKPRSQTPNPAKAPKSIPQLQVASPGPRIQTQILILDPTPIPKPDPDSRPKPSTGPEPPGIAHGTAAVPLQMAAHAAVAARDGHTRPTQGRGEVPAARPEGWGRSQGHEHGSAGPWAAPRGWL